MKGLIIFILGKMRSYLYRRHCNSLYQRGNEKTKFANLFLFPENNESLYAVFDFGNFGTFIRANLLSTMDVVYS